MDIGSSFGLTSGVQAALVRGHDDDQNEGREDHDNRSESDDAGVLIAHDKGRNEGQDHGGATNAVHSG